MSSIYHSRKIRMKIAWSVCTFWADKILAWYSSSELRQTSSLDNVPDKRDNTYEILHFLIIPGGEFIMSFVPAWSLAMEDARLNFQEASIFSLGRRSRWKKCLPFNSFLRCRQKRWFIRFSSLLSFFISDKLHLRRLRCNPLVITWRFPSNQTFTQDCKTEIELWFDFNRSMYQDVGIGAEGVTVDSRV